ncbi:two-component system sensor histidine kinase/response regulator [Rhodoblastus sphagnicola]|uniref:Two-component system sensor histidine kinase/response regulator n=1 Tax=Rhodoblastus sphagnicola TaxID=333368 RepID=A0A2S6N8X7_9HYPH|nr:response regulator [Rhodoblastus sphagnicola]MBB4196854.1 two-component system chemotaxis response regulator CheY [Rhodoblastus sphagnicola]PPQ31076.1 two-component system sensor histidine kinase/response regulator [Rhodoblastus sphagnicola]
MTDTVLIVDDSPSIRFSISTILSKTHLDAQTASSAEEALSLMQAGLRPHILITDLHMGPMDGVELIRQTRKIPGLQFIPILMLTTESHRAERQEAKDAGGTGWLVKPVDGLKLLQLVAQLAPES